MPKNCGKIDQLEVSLIYLRPDQFHLICHSNHNPLNLIKCDLHSIKQQAWNKEFHIIVTFGWKLEIVIDLFEG